MGFKKVISMFVIVYRFFFSIILSMSVYTHVEKQFQSERHLLLSPFWDTKGC